MALSKEIILQVSNKGMAVFRHYIPFPFQVGRNFLNPLYPDKNASCNVFFDRRNDCYRLKDFGNEDYSGDCFFFVGKLCGLDCNRPSEFVLILEKINHDLLLGLIDDRGFKVVESNSQKLLVLNQVREPSSPAPLSKNRKYNSFRRCSCNKCN